MIVDFGGYEPYRPLLAIPPAQMERRDARAQYDDVMARRPERREQLGGLVSRHGLVLDGSDDALAALSEWYVRSVTVSEDGSGRMEPVWYAVAFDFALFVGDTMIERLPGLSWRLLTGGKRELGYQRHVIMGFHTPNKRYNIDLQWVIAVFGVRAAQGLDYADTLFLDQVRGAEEDWREYPPPS